MQFDGAPPGAKNNSASPPPGIIFDAVPDFACRISSILFGSIN
jgi:hypothetical protein